MQGDALFTLHNTREILGYFDRFLKETVYIHVWLNVNGIVQVGLGDRVSQHNIYLYVNVEKCLVRNTLKNASSSE